MDDELESHDVNHTWKSTLKVPEGFRALGYKWVFTTKRDENGVLERPKARLVLQGFRQRKGFDFNETFSPVVMINSLRMVLTAAAVFDYEVHNLDVSTAYLNASLAERVYMRDPNDPDLVVQLIKALYGGKQSGRAWHECICSHLKEMSYEQVPSDPCVYIMKRSTSSGVLYVCIFVDDLLLVGDINVIKDFKSEFASKFKITDKGETKQFIGTRDRGKRTIMLSQRVYTNEILSSFGMANCSSTHLMFLAKI